MVHALIGTKMNDRASHQNKLDAGLNLRGYFVSVGWIRLQKYLNKSDNFAWMTTRPC
jgi:hypothetical protein